MIRRGARDRLRRASPLAFVGLLVFCGPSLPVPEVEYSDCWAVYLPGPKCVLRPERELKLWVKAGPGTDVEIRADGERLPVDGEEVSGGRRYLLSLPRPASSLTVQLRQPGGGRGASWSLQLAEPEEPAWVDEVEQLVGSGRREEARQQLGLRRTTAPRKEQGLILHMLWYLAYQSGDQEEAMDALERGMKADRAVNCVSGEARKATMLARLYLDQGRYGDARQSLELRLPPGASADEKYHLAFNQGLLADRVGDYRSALEQLGKAANLAERVGRVDNLWAAEVVRARLFQDIGRSGEAEQLFKRLRAGSPTNPCDKAVLLTNWGWSLLLAREAGEEAEDPTPILEEAQAIYEGCARPDQRLNARLNLAFAHQQAGRWRDARRELRQARALGVQPSIQQGLWWDDLEARAAIHEGDPARALRLYDQLEEVAERALSLEGYFRVALGRAHARRALGQREEMFNALADADRLIDEQSRRVPVHEGLDTFVAQREEATRLYLELLLEDGQQQPAFALARRARSRLLRQLTWRDRLAQLTPEEQQRWDGALEAYRSLRADIDREAEREWQLPRDQVEHHRRTREAQLRRAQAEIDRAMAELRDLGGRTESSLSPPRPGEVVLAYHPLRGKWAGFAAHERGVEVSTFELPDQAYADPAALARILLSPFRHVIERAERVRVLPYGRLRSVDFQALPFDGAEPLLARVPVAYGLDLPARPSPVLPSEPVALLVADPQGDLPTAREEAEEVEAAARGWGSAWTLERLDGTAAGAEAVREALPGATLFHYAGHGTFAGFGGWDSMLVLADGSRLTLGDLLALRQAPPWVVLSACDAGRSSAEAPGEGVGLANAFLLAGSHAVVAPTRPVSDRTARLLQRELYRGWRPGMEMDLARQLQRAQLACRRHDPEGWASFRLLEP